MSTGWRGTDTGVCRWGMGVGTKQVQARVQTGAHLGAAQMSVQEQVWAEERARFLSPSWTAVALSGVSL